MVIRNYYVYIMMNQSGSVLYTGVTNDLPRRICEHHECTDTRPFVSRYRATRLVYFETHNEIRFALEREKQIKGWARWKKEQLIRSMNPKLLDLTSELVYHHQP